jgi:hypothetical protein
VGSVNVAGAQVLLAESRTVGRECPGEIVGVDCFYAGRLAVTAGTVRQYTAIDIASGSGLAELQPLSEIRWRNAPGRRARG